MCGCRWRGGGEGEEGGDEGGEGEEEVERG